MRQVSIADIPFNWPRLTWPALALHHAEPRVRKMSATSRRGPRHRQAGGGRLARFTPSRSKGLVTSRIVFDGDAGVERGRLQLGVSEQDLDHANVDVLFEQMGGEAVPQGVRRHALGDSVACAAA